MDHNPPAIEPRKKGRPKWPTRLRYAPLMAILALSTTSPPALAQICPGSAVTGPTHAQRMSSGFTMGVGMALYDFIGTMGCTAMAYGPTPPPTCFVRRLYSSIPSAFFTAALTARWMGMASQNIPANRCRFNCQGGVCVVIPSAFFTAALTARWMGMASQNIPANRCRFNCQGGVCVVSVSDLRKTRFLGRVPPECAGPSLISGWVPESTSSV